MADINDEVIAGLTSAITALLPPVADLDLRPVLMVNPVRITPTGLGGFVGPSADPPGDVVGRRMEARVSVTVKAEDDDGLGPAVTRVTHAVLGAERGTLLEQGILRVVLGELGPRAMGPGGSRSAQIVRRDVDFTVLYEYLRRPEEGEGIIREIPLTVSPPAARVAPAGPGGPADEEPVPPPPPPPPPEPEPLLTGDFTAASLALFEGVDDPLTTRSRPSDWRWAEAERRIEQRSGIFGGASRIPSLRPGTYLVLRSGDSRPALADLDLTVRMEAGSPGGIGLVFRWQDVDNFYFFLMDAQRGSRILARKVGGSFSDLDTPAFDGGTGFATGTPHDVRLSVRGTVFQVEIDGAPALRGEDASLAGAGRVGLMCRACDQAFFYGMDLRRP